MKEDYIEQHLDPPVETGAKSETDKDSLDTYPESIRRLFKPDIRYEKGGREMVTLEDGYALEYTYEPVDDPDFHSYSPASEYDSAIGRKDEANSGFRKLTSLCIKNEKGEGLDLMKDFTTRDFQVPDIFFKTDDRSSEKESRLIRGKIISSISPNSFLGIMAMLHEVGHAVALSEKIANPNLENLKSMMQKKIGRKILKMPSFIHTFIPKQIVEPAVGEVLKSERDAWAVAVSALKRTINAFGVSREDLISAIHGGALTSYSEGIREVRNGLSLKDAKEFILGIFQNRP